MKTYKKVLIAIIAILILPIPIMILLSIGGQTFSEYQTNAALLLFGFDFILGIIFSLILAEDL